jgi:hypothetical protein
MGTIKIINILFGFDKAELVRVSGAVTVTSCNLKLTANCRLNFVVQLKALLTCTFLLRKWTAVSDQFRHDTKQVLYCDTS